MRAVAALAVVLLAAGCGSSVPVPPTGPRNTVEVTVPYPPPPARVEIVPPQPSAATPMVWVDGEWLWKGRRWVWKAGQWQLPQPGAYYAPSTTVRLSDGSLAWYAGGWRMPEK